MDAAINLEVVMLLAFRRLAGEWLAKVLASYEATLGDARAKYLPTPPSSLPEEQDFMCPPSG